MKSAHQCRGVGLSVVVLAVILPSFTWADSGKFSFVSSVSDEVIDSLSSMASDVRVDKPSKKESLHPAASLNASAFALYPGDISSRTSSVREDSRLRTFSSSFISGDYTNSTYAENSQSGLGTYMRVDRTQPQFHFKSSPFDRTAPANNSYSLTMGGDYLLNNNYLFGLALGMPSYQSSDYENEGGNDIDGLVASGYFSYFENEWFLDFTASYALIDTDMSRQVNMYTDPVVSSMDDADSDVWVFMLGGGYVIDYPYAKIALESSVQYTLSDRDRYNERLSKGNSNYVISQVDDVNKLEGTTFITGATISKPFRTSLGLFQPYVKSYLHYDYQYHSDRIISQFKSMYSSSDLPVITQSNDQFYGRFHAGVSGAFNDKWIGYAEASTLVGLNDMNPTLYSMGVIIPFK
ncbi:autotransporter outer membrane beta-barrel domain-containing protein [Photobacterium sp. TLY01]|uniref:autotransporter outer membrane beta-barrel domain-containing protein n=1 Tax=Photobacterium sp. TLY01 TaxID=2907534 RepID=UPI001F15D721|nr:autotransporter outer membrane beta-barrel domain-containing protein [Photobacterium sp. TLY01]UIP30011.1 autotransporter outer membrane beta-barrel domain-containing protein [Photobacterium sp. TLY01]